MLAEDSGASPSDGQGSQWLPVVGGSVVSVLDVAPLKLVGKYMDDISNAIREHQRRCLESRDFYLKKQPLFPHPICPSPEGNASSPNSNEVSPNHRAPKKTLAATLVESTKKQSVALVSSEIAKLAQPFYSLFNPALFPHKPPSSAVANRVLFTDAEDVLVAMGMMEYNNDWKAIQQRFLPCKSEHQIFVRAKNRCSSKAPENPIKTVRKMKTSPLTEEEIVRIQEGLKTFKDWSSVWRFVVPYRDPNLLPRQWRTAIGTQKSYKGDAAKRERHRIYEARRRRSKMGLIDYSMMGAEENANGEDYMDNNNEAYVHEAFLADWRPTPCGPDLSKLYISNQPECLRDVPNYQSDKGNARNLPPSLKDKSLHPYTTHNARNSGKGHVSNLVKLAPELPPVKLPSAVRIISQSSLRIPQLGSTSEAAAFVPGQTGFDSSGSFVKPTQDGNKMSRNKCVTKEKNTESDSQMHPLLFRTIEEGGHLPCYPVHNSIRIPTFSFFPALQHQLNNQTLSSKEIAPESSSLDFHPLLKRSKGFSGGPHSLDSDLTNSFLNTNLELSRDQFVEDIVYNAGASAAEIGASTIPVSPNPDANGLDLDIHLNSTCKRRKVSSIESPEKDENAGSHLEINVPESSIDGNNGLLCVDANVGDNSLSEIVMEQEELSDSDEELEDVEFEREEMEDSDGEEESGSDQVDNTLMKDKPGLGSGIDTPTRLSKSLVSETSEGTQVQKKGRKPRLVSAGPPRAHTKSSWLSLNSNGSQLKPLTRTKKAETSERGPHPNRKSKKGVSGAKDVSSSEQNKDISQQDPFFNALKKPRKHCKSSSPLRVDSCTDKDGKV